MNALDIHNSSSCWNSEGIEQGSSRVGTDRTNQWIRLDFGRRITPVEVRIQFQAGFAGESCILQGTNEEKDWDWDTVDEMEFEDVHEVQIHALETADRSRPMYSSLKLAFSDLTDFYGRVTIYRLEIWGYECI